MSLNPVGSKTAPTPPPKLVPIIFILADHETAALSCDIVEALSNLDDDLTGWSFAEPVFDAATCFARIEFDTPLYDPRKHQHGDLLKALHDWVDKYFGPDHLSKMALGEVLEGRKYGFEQTIVFRDANWQHIKTFLPHFKAHEFLIVDLKSYGYTKVLPITEEEYKNIGSRILLFGKPTVENVVAAILEASK